MPTSHPEWYLPDKLITCTQDGRVARVPTNGGTPTDISPTAAQRTMLGSVVRMLEDPYDARKVYMLGTGAAVFTNDITATPVTWTSRSNVFLATDYHVTFDSNGYTGWALDQSWNPPHSDAAILSGGVNGSSCVYHPGGIAGDSSKPIDDRVSVIITLASPRTVTQYTWWTNEFTDNIYYANSDSQTWVTLLDQNGATIHVDAPYYTSAPWAQWLFHDSGSVSYAGVKTVIVTQTAQNIFGSPTEPALSDIHIAVSAQSDLPGPGVPFGDFQAAPNRRDTFYWLSKKAIGGGNYDVYFNRTTDAFQTSYSTRLAGFDASMVYGIAPSPFSQNTGTGNVVWVTAGSPSGGDAAVYESQDWGTSFTPLNTPSLSTGGGALTATWNALVGLFGASNQALMVAQGIQGGTLTTSGVGRQAGAISSVNKLIANAGLSSYWFNGQAVNLVLYDGTNYRLATSDNGGHTWSVNATALPGEGRSLCGIGGTSDYLVISGASTLAFSLNRGATWPAQQNLWSGFQSWANTTYGSGQWNTALVSTLVASPRRPTYDGQGLCPLCFIEQLLAFLQGNPISMQDGDKYESVTDLSLTTPAGALSFTRTYRQSKQTDSTFQFMGLGWTHSHKASLVKNTGVSPNVIHVWLPNASIAQYTYVADLTGGKYQYDGDPGLASSLVEDTNSASARYTVTASDLSTWVFDSAGLLRSRAWPSGETWTYTYDGSSRLSRVDDGYGRQLNFVYVVSAGFDNGQLWRVGDQNATGLSGSTPGGVYVEFGYTPQKQNGATIASPKALLATVRDVRGYVWSYDYYGQHGGETDTNLYDFLTASRSPLLDLNGDGLAEGMVTREQLTYTRSGGQISQIVQARGQQGTAPALESTTYSFDASGGFTTETVAGQTTTHRFGNGLYLGSDDPAGHSQGQALGYHYRPETQRDANGNATRLLWSLDGKQLQQVQDAYGHTTAFAYNTTGDAKDNTLASSTDAEGRQTVYLYTDPNYLRAPSVVKVLDKDGLTVLRWQAFSYDSKGRTLKEQTLNPADGQTVLQETTRTYAADNAGNGAGLVRTVTQRDTVNPANDVTTTYFYDSAGRTIRTNQSFTFGRCTSSFTLYDAAGNVLASVCSYDPGNLPDPTSLQGLLALYHPAQPEKNRVTVYGYDALGRRVQTITNAGRPEAQTTLTVYDALDRVVRSIANYVPDARISDPFVHDRKDFDAGPDQTWNLISETVYNERGQVRKSIDLLGNVTVYGYDAAGRLVRTVQNASQPDYNNTYAGDPELKHYIVGSAVDQDIALVNAYDPNGNLVKTTDATGSVTLTGYDALNRVVRTVRSASQPDYDLTGDPTLSRYVPSSEADQDLVDDTEYDALGRVRRTRDTAGRWTLLGYDGLGRQVKTVRNASQPDYPITADPSLSQYPISDAVDVDVVSVTLYDAQGRPAQSLSGVGKTGTQRSFTGYDGLGRAVRSIVGYVPDTRIADPATAPRAVFEHGADNSANLASDTVYDANGFVSKTIDPLGNVTLYGYDAYGRSVRVIQNASQPNYNTTRDLALAQYVLSDAPDQDLISQTVYDRRGNASKTIDALGNVSLTGYDALNRVVRTVRNARQPDYDLETDPDLSQYVPSTAADVDFVESTDYDRAGRVRRRTDTVGTVTGSPESKLSGVAVTLFGYDRLGRQVKIIQAASQPDYDTEADPDLSQYVVTSAPDQDIVSQTAYDRSGQVASTTDMLGRKRSVRYDRLSRAVRTVTNDSGLGTDNVPDQDRVQTTHFNRAGQVEWTQDPLGRRTWMVYDGLGRALRTIANASSGVADGSPADPRHPNYIVRAEADVDLVSRTEYDGQGRVAATIDPGGVRTVYRYDALGRRVTTVQNFVTGTFRADAPDQDVTSTTAYDLGGRVSASTDARGTRTALGYDRAGRTRTLTQAAGTPLATVNYTCYDKGGRAQRTIQNFRTDPSQPLPDARDDAGGWRFSPEPRSLNNDENLISVTTFDRAGRPIAQSDPLGNSTHMTYTKDGLLDTLSDPEGMVTVYRYDRLRRRTLVVQGYTPGALSDPGTWRWDGAKWVDGNGQPIAFGAKNDQNVIVQVEYDKAGRMTALRDPRGNRTRYTYDRLDRRTGLTDPLEHLWATAYATLPAGGGRTTLTDPLGYQTQQDTDAAGRLKTVRYLNESPKLTPDVDFGYDKRGNRLRMTETDTNGLVRETTYAYDRMHRLSSLNDGAQTVTYKYDAGGLRTSLTLPDGKTVQYTYDAKGQLLRLTDWANQTTRYGYDRVGRLRIADRPNCLRSRYGYDAAGRLRVLRHTAEGKTLGHFAFEVDKRGNRTQAYEALPRATNGSTTLDKDSTAIQYPYGTWSTVTSYKETTDFSAVMRMAVFGRDLTLTLGTGPDFSLCDMLINGLLWNSIDGYATANGEQVIAISLTQEGPHTVEIRNRADKNPASTGYRFRFKSLVTAAGTPLYDVQTIQYTYDALSRVIGANYYPDQNTITPSRTYSFTYDLAGNRTQANNNGTVVNYTYNAVNQISSGGVTYDAAGRMTNDGTSAYTWDRADRLLTVGGTQYSYAYNGVGQRIQQSVGATVTKYLLDTQLGLFQILTETTGSNVTRYVQGPTGLQQIQQPSGTWQHIIPDALGSVRGVVDNNNAMLDTRLYAPYGEVFGPTGSSQTEYGFTGEMTDGNGLVYLRARYYNSGMGVFTGIDPLEGQMDKSGRLNRYAWVEGNVANRVDPGGTESRSNPFGVGCFQQTFPKCNCFRFGSDLYNTQVYLKCIEDCLESYAFYEASPKIQSATVLMTIGSNYGGSDCAKNW